MNEKQQHGAAAPPPRPETGPETEAGDTSLWMRFKSWLNWSAVFPRDDLRQALREATVAGGGEIFSPGERSLIQNVLNLSQVRIDDVMVPRADIEAVEIDIGLGD
ncbi:MAG: magnesium/cobalt efflux protein, partial [Cucumibacter sp.]